MHTPRHPDSPGCCACALRQLCALTHVALSVSRRQITRHCLMDIQNQYADRAAELESQSVPGIPGQGAPAPPPSFGAASQLGLSGAGPPSQARWHGQPLQQRVENRMRRGPQTFNKDMVKDSTL